MASLELKSCLNITDDFPGYDPELFTIPKHYKESIKKVLIPYGLIQDRIEKVAADIFNELILNKNEPIAVICVLKGGYRFFSDLLNQLNKLNVSTTTSIRISVDFIRLKSYVDDKSTGEVQIIGLDNWEMTFRNKNILIVEDIIDTGKTMVKLHKTLEKYTPKKVTVATLLRKRTVQSSGYVPDYVAFEIPDEFIIGYACDFNEHFRDMAHICVINEYGMKKYKA